MNVENPALIASMEMLWLRENGTEVSVQASTGMPYEDQGAWACPAALTGVDNRYPEVVGQVPGRRYGSPSGCYGSASAICWSRAQCWSIRMSVTAAGISTP